MWNISLPCETPCEMISAILLELWHPVKPFSDPVKIQATLWKDRHPVKRY